MDKKLSDTQSISGDSGCNLSTTTETSDLTELYQDFRVIFLIRLSNSK